MATDTVPAAVPGPPDPPGHTAGTNQESKGFLAAMMAPVEPARPTFDLARAAGDATQAASPDGPVDRSAPGVSSASFRDTAEQATKGADPAGARHKRSVWKEILLAAATRLAKGGGAANKRLDLAKARAQAHQVKETRTTTVTKSGGIPVRNSGGSGVGSDKGTGKSGGNSSRKGPVNSSGSPSNGAGRSGSGSSGGSGGGRGPGGGSGSSASGASGRSGKDTGSSGKDSSGAHRGRSGAGSSGQLGAGGGAAGGEKNKKTVTPTTIGKDGGKQSPAGSGGGAEKPGAAGKHGKDGSTRTTGTGTGGTNSGSRPDLTKQPNDGNAKSRGGDGDRPRSQHHDKTGTKPTGQQQPAAAQKTPLQKSREIGHGDGTKARRIVDHVKAYTDGTRDGWHDEKTNNAKEHQRLDKAHTAHQPKAHRPTARIITEKGDDGVTTDVKPLTVNTIDANTLTLGTEGARTTVGRRELRNFKQYERKLEAKETVLQKIAEACARLATEAEDEAKDCQQLVEQAKSVKGGEKLVGTLTKLAEAAKNQATEAATLAQRARKAAEMCKTVLTNIQTRYAPLYKAVVDSDETKPAELRFYNDKGTYAPAA
ncbi:hypothetical protein [Streptomyces leeuwenhoekii]|uniref:Sle1_115 protein n=1 Tax=Streptomyces leeuwenhoekii TaxID=1437453 RepID=A0A0F7VPJ3_STRLW|nr:hypothetical protein [Streptomyces leeuwenhoekii]CQR59282.1 sle1_115 [Streptomyces leeuwenhoekii]